MRGCVQRPSKPGPTLCPKARSVVSPTFPVRPIRACCASGAEARRIISAAPFRVRGKPGRGNEAMDRAHPEARHPARVASPPGRARCLRASIAASLNLRIRQQPGRFAARVDNALGEYVHDPSHSDAPQNCAHSRSERQLAPPWRGRLWVITASPSALGTEALYAILRTVRDFESFTPENDPFGEHDCALLEAAGQRIVFKIDYYDRQIQGTSPDPPTRASPAAYSPSRWPTNTELHGPETSSGSGPIPLGLGRGPPGAGTSSSTASVPRCEQALPGSEKRHSRKNRARSRRVKRNARNRMS